MASKRLVALVVLGLAWGAVGQAADVYRCPKPSGGSVYSYTPCPGGVRVMSGNQPYSPADEMRAWQEGEAERQERTREFREQQRATAATEAAARAAAAAGRAAEDAAAAAERAAEAAQRGAYPVTGYARQPPRDLYFTYGWGPSGCLAAPPERRPSRPHGGLRALPAK